MKYIPYIFVSVLILCFLFEPSPDKVGFMIGGRWWTYLTYNFFHVNFLHLALNCYGLFVVLRVLPKYGNILIIMAGALTASMTAAILSPHVLPTIGISGFIFALIGMYSVIMISSNNKNSIVFFLLTLGWIYLGFFLNVNSLLHLGSFLFGFIFYIIYKWNE